MAVDRNICVITGTRAEYGLLRGLMMEIQSDPSLTLSVVVTGTHLEPKYGNTVQIIEEDGFFIDKRIPCNLRDDSPATILAAMGAVMSGLSAGFDDIKPDIAVILGDRFEALAAAEACVVCGVPIAHIHGGEKTEGAIDDAMRHAITKLAHLHFAAAEPYRNRIIQMGEAPERVFNVGAPGLDGIDQAASLSRSEVYQTLGIHSDFAGYFLVTYHPVTLDRTASKAGAENLAKALDAFRDFAVVLTGVNADPGRDAIENLMAEFSERQPERVRLFSSLGQHRYLNAMAHSAAVIGNSSSGLIEAPALGVPTVNIGERQRGRLCAPSVISCEPTEVDIVRAIHAALDPKASEIAARRESPYGIGDASRQIKQQLKSVPLGEILRKSFHDIKLTDSTLSPQGY